MVARSEGSPADVLPSSETGGSYVYNSLSGALLLLSQIIAANNPRFPGFKYDLIDKLEAMEWIKHLWLVATHLPYGCISITSP